MLKIPTIPATILECLGHFRIRIFRHTLRITFLPLTEWQGKVGISALKNNSNSSSSSNSNSIKMKEIEDNKVDSMINKKLNQLRMDNYKIEKAILMQECNFLGSRRISGKNYVGLKFHKEKRKYCFFELFLFLGED